MVINVCYLHLSTFFFEVRICQTQKSDGLSPTDCLHYSHMSQHIPNSDGAGKTSHWGCSFSECKIKPIEKKSIRILILFDMQHQHTLKGPRHDLSLKFRIFFFIDFLCLEWLLLMLYQILKVKDSLSYKQNIQSSLLLFTYVLLWYMFNQIMFFWGGNNSIHVHIKLFYIVCLESFCQKK